MTIWYDYTTTLRNTGRSGIANVEWSIGRELRELRPDVGVFASQERSGLSVLDADVDLRDAVYARSGDDALAIGSALPPPGSGLRHAVLGALSGRPPWVMRTALLTYHSARRLGTIASNRRRRRSPRIPARPLLRERVRSDDVVVSMGADWGGQLADELGALRAATGCRVVTMVYDLIPLSHSHLAFHNDPAFFRAYFAGLLRSSDLVTCISEQTQRDLLQFAATEGLPAPRTAVLRLGEELHPDATVEADEVAVTDERTGDFYLWVGTVERRKNLELLYDALRIIESTGAAVPTIVVAGSVGWGVSDLLDELAQQASAASRAIVMLGSVDDHVLDGLYRRARALLFPSHYEGWGLPVREAAVRGCPVAVGDSPAVREATADIVGATILPVDDPGPWASFLSAPAPRRVRAVVHAWSATAAQLTALVDGFAAGPEVAT
ncbi:MAG: glycosyltransferase [Ilumatobacteraceae bacterium]